MKFVLIGIGIAIIYSIWRKLHICADNNSIMFSYMNKYENIMYLVG